jgi:hypothetical protein
MHFPEVPSRARPSISGTIDRSRFVYTENPNRLRSVWTRPSIEARILELRAKGHGIHRIRKTLGLGTSVVQRVFNQDPWEKFVSRAQMAKGKA